MIMGIRPKQYARLGVFYLEEPILDVLLESKYTGEYVGAMHIGRRTGKSRR